MRELTKTEMLYVTSLIVSFVLFFVGVGLLLSNVTNVVVPYAVLLTAIVLSSSTLVVGFFNTRKTVVNQTEIKPVMPVVEVPIEKPVVTTSPVVNEQIVQKVGSNYGESKIEPIEQLITLPVDVQKIQESSIAQPANETKLEDQKTIKPHETTSAIRDAVKSTTNKKTVTKRAKAKARKTKGV